MSATMYVCKGSGTQGAARQDAVGWCPVCHKLQRAKVGTGRLLPHLTPYKAKGEREVRTP